MIERCDHISDSMASSSTNTGKTKILPDSTDDDEHTEVEDMEEDDDEVCFSIIESNFHFHFDFTCADFFIVDYAARAF